MTATTAAQEKKITQHRASMREVDEQIRSQRVLTMICTHEETRVLDALLAICKRGDHNWTLLEWDVANGVRARTPFELPEKTQMDHLRVLRWFSSEEDVASDPKGPWKVLVLKDFYKFLKDDDFQGRQVVRLLKNLSTGLIGKRKAIILTGAEFYLPSELEKACAVIDWPLLEYETILSQLNDTLQHAGTMPEVASRFKLDYTEQERDEIARAFAGLTLFEIELLSTKTIIREPAFNPDSIGKKKRDIIRKAGVLDWRDVVRDFTQVGGLLGLKGWLKRREGAFSAEAQAFGLPANPKGVLLVGVQGAGKSLCAEAIASFWKLPLLQLDMGSVFSGIVGSSEANIRNAIRVAESVAPCVLMIDEIDKGLAGSGSSDRTDGGTSARVLGTLLTWMQNKTSQVFVVATANQVDHLPAALLRKGRFDEIFFVDLPSERERIEIFRIHLSSRGRKPEDFDLTALAKATDLYTGAEIEAVIIAALYEAFSDGKRGLRNDDILNAAAVTVPIVKTMEEEVESIRKWAGSRAVPASGVEPLFPLPSALTELGGEGKSGAGAKGKASGKGAATSPPGTATEIEDEEEL
jgi:hypothetical protein